MRPEPRLAGGRAHGDADRDGRRRRGRGGAPAALAAAPERPSVRAIRAMHAANAAGCARVATMLKSPMDRPPKDASIEEGIAFCKRLFDWSVRQSEEASGALYPLGSAEVLRAATREIVDLFESWGSLGPETRALDIG